MYYLYDKESSEAYAKSATEPTEGLYCKYEQDIDLVLYRLIVGMVDENKNLTYPQIKARPAEDLAKQIKEQQKENELLTSQVKSSTERSDFLEDCLTELAAKMYV